MTEPVRVEAVRVKGDNAEFPGDKADQHIGGYEITSKPVAVSEEDVQTLLNTLGDSDTYGWAFAKGCQFYPGAAVRFVGKDRKVEILFCFGCEELMVLLDGERVGGEDFDHARTAFVKVMQSIFPDDKPIQGLKTREELNAIADAEAKQRSVRMRRRARLMPEPVIAAIIDNDGERLETELLKHVPDTSEQIRLLLRFEGGSNQSWTTHIGIENAVDALLRSYSADDLKQPVRKSLLGDDRQARRGAARFWGTWRSPLQDWQPDNLPTLLGIRLTVMHEDRYYPTRQRGLLRLERWSEQLEEEEVTQRLQAGLHDPHPSVRRQAMLVAARLKHPGAASHLMNVLRGESVTVVPLPEVPSEETENVPEGYDRVAGKRPESEVAALALGLLGHEPAITLIEETEDPTPMHDVALALLGRFGQLKANHFNGTEKNKDLQQAAVEAVVRSRGRHGLEFAIDYKQVQYWWEKDRVTESLRTMLVEENAPGLEQLKSCRSLKDLRSWYDAHKEDWQKQITAG